MPDQSHFDKIEAYLTGQLTEQEARAFEDRMAGDEELATEVELQRLEHDSMELMLEQDLKKKFSRWEDQPPANPYEEPETVITHIGSQKRNWRFLSIAAVIALLIVSFLAYRQYIQQPPPENVTQQNPEKDPSITPPVTPPEEEVRQDPDIPIANAPEKTNPEIPKQPAEKKELPYQEPKKENTYLALALNTYEEPPPFASGLKSGEEQPSEPSTYTRAAKAYDDRRYSEALSILGQPTEGDQSTLRYLRGHTHFKLKNYRAAATEFEAVAANDFAPDYQEAQWYLLLSYLTEMPAQKEKFETLAKQLAGDKYFTYRREAKKLLEEVEKENDN